jgi:hypothetical protein
LAAADVNVVADQMQNRLSGGKMARAVNGVTIAQRFRLVYKMEPAGVIARLGDISVFISGPDDDTQLLDAGAEHLFDEDA